jgi:hypothetical protein
MRPVLMLSAVLLLAAGCGGGKLAAVSGRVTIDGKPAPNVHVAFEPIGSADNPNPGYGSVGVTDAQGIYRLQTFWPKKENGAVVGKHRVRINLQGPQEGELGQFARPPGKKAAAVPQLPWRYNEQTELTYEVPAGGTDGANFDLMSK